MREQQQPSMLFCIGVCAAYGATSVVAFPLSSCTFAVRCLVLTQTVRQAITFANKAVLTSFNFHFELSLILLQVNCCLSRHPPRRIRD